MSRFIAQEVIDQIRAASDIVDVIQWLNVPLKKSGASYRALCPFHKEKTPSFHVRRERQAYHCFGCGAAGDVFKFVMAREGLEFPDATRRLAERARITIPEGSTAPMGPNREQRDQLCHVHLKVGDWFHANLMRSRQAGTARRYLRERGFTSATAMEFKLGYALPAWDALLRWGSAHGIESRLLEESGLVLKGRQNVYDRFRDRLMIPINDENGRTVGFSGRLLSADAKEARYINSPETAIFKKGRILFGLDRSKRDLQENNLAVICEGQFDWIRCFESGIRNVIAPQGTAFTEEQARILNRYVEEVVLCFDSDVAGQKATWRNAETLIAAGLSVKAARLPDGEDPDSFIHKSGADALKDRLKQALDVFEYKALSFAQSLNMKESRNHQKVVLEMTPLLQLVEDEPRRQQLIQNICDILKMDTPAFLHEFDRQRRRLSRNSSISTAEKTQVVPSGAGLEDQMLGFGDYFLQLALTEKVAAQILANDLEEAWFGGYALRRVLFHVVRKSRSGKWQPGWNGLDLDLDDGESQMVARLLMHPIRMSSRDMAIGIQDAIARVRRAWLLEQHGERTRLLKNTDLGEKERIQFQTELLDLEKQIK